MTRRDALGRRVTPEVVAIGAAIGLVIALFLALVDGRTAALIGFRDPDACASTTWRNPITGKIEIFPHARVTVDGVPVCQDH